MSEIKNYEADAELAFCREHRDVINIFRYVVRTERRSYFTNDTDARVRASPGREVFFEVNLSDA